MSNVTESKKITEKITYRWSGSIEVVSGRKVTATLNATSIRLSGLPSNYSGVSVNVPTEDLDAVIELLAAAKLAVIERDAE
jgi:hypothetical protein